MGRAGTVALAVAVLLLVMLFTRGNGSERVSLELGIVSFDAVPLAYVVLGSFFVGMLVMMVAGIHTDLRVRRLLMDRLEEEDLRERARLDQVDRNQRDLFLPAEEEEDY